MTMTDHAPPPVVRLVPTDAIRALRAKYGATYPPGWNVTLALTHGIPIPDCRHLAANFRATTDPDLPDRPSKVADELDALADRVESRPVADWDAVILADGHRELLDGWADACDAASPLLSPVSEALRELCGGAAAPVFARRVLAVLADADLLLPGVDAALRDVLALYAGRRGDEEGEDR